MYNSVIAYMQISLERSNRTDRIAREKEMGGMTGGKTEDKTLLLN